MKRVFFKDSEGTGGCFGTVRSSKGGSFFCQESKPGIYLLDQPPSPPPPETNKYTLKRLVLKYECHTYVRVCF